MLNEGILTFTASGTLEAKRRVKIKAATATVPPEVEYCGAGDPGIGFTEYKATVGQPIAVRLDNYPGSKEAVAAKAIAVATAVYAAANGMISDAVSGASIGMTKEAATALNDIIEIVQVN